MTSPLQDSNTIWLKRLVFAVWVLAVVTSLHLLLSIAGLFFPRLFVQEFPGWSSNQVTSENVQPTDPNQGFADWPIEKQIEQASVIARTEWQKRPDGRLTPIQEILKHGRDAPFYYSVGDALSSHSVYPRESTSYGEGQIFFFIGSPATMRYAVTYTRDRIGGLGDMPLALFREKIQNHERR